MGKSSLCPGFRFSPTDVELVMYYLKKKLLGKKLIPEVIAEVNIYGFSPWDLPAKSNLRNGDLEWFFFCPKSKKYSSGSRMNRATEAGYWKATGKDREVKYKDKSVAKIKTLVFHLDHPPKGKRTNWVMHEYRMEDKDLADVGVFQEAYVLCKLFEKSGAGPKNGAQYGAPFEEEDWDADDSGCTESSALFGLSGVTETVNTKRSSSAVTKMGSSEPGPSTVTSEKERHLETSTVMSLSLIGLSGATKALNPSTSTSSVMPSTESGPSTLAFSGNERHVDVPAGDDGLTHEDVASILHNNNIQEVNDRKGKKVMTIEDDGIFRDLGALSNLDAFNMFSVDESADYMLDTFLPDDLDIDLEKFFMG